jgi:hypothetical protein
MDIRDAHIVAEAARDAIQLMYNGMRWVDAIRCAQAAAPVVVQTTAIAAVVEVMTR